MRSALVVTVALAGVAAGAPSARGRAPASLRVSSDAAHLDLDGHALECRPSRAVASAGIVAVGEDGAEIGSGSASYTDAASPGWLRITWTQRPDTRVMILKLRVVAEDGRA